MESKKSQGPSRAVLVSSAVVLCAVLVGAAYFLRDEGTPIMGAPSSPAASTLQPLFERCDGEPSVEVVDGLTRTTCTSRQHPAFMVYQDVTASVIVRAGLMVPMHGRQGQLAERTLTGLELFSLMAGETTESFLPPESVADIGVRATRVVREGLAYETQPVANVGLIFTVTPAALAPDAKN
jgi:hypothetical protein